MPFAFRKIIEMSASSFRKQRKVDETTNQAKAFLRRTDTRERLCPFLSAAENNLSKLLQRTIENDAAEIACAITSILAPLVRTKTISINMDPLLFALMAWVIARTGITTYCAGYAGGAATKADAA